MASESEPVGITADFALGRRELAALLCIQKALLIDDIQTTKDAGKNEKASLKSEWAADWSKLTSGLGGDSSFVPDAQAARTLCQELSSGADTRIQFHLMILETVAFAPYVPLPGHDNPKRFKGLGWHDEAATIRTAEVFASLLGLPTGTAKRYQDSLTSAVNGITGKWTRLAIYTLAGGLAIAVTGGIAAVPIAGAIGAAAGLSGAAAVSFGLAVLGGGTLAAGGFGMAGGVAVIVGGGALVGAGMGAGGAVMLAQESSDLTLFQAAKLEVVLKEVILAQHKDVAKAQEIIRAQRRAICEMENQLDTLSVDREQKAQQIDSLEKSVEYLKTALRRNRGDFLNTARSQRAPLVGTPGTTS